MPAGTGVVEAGTEASLAERGMVRSDGRGGRKKKGQEKEDEERKESVNEMSEKASRNLSQILKPTMAIPR